MNILIGWIVIGLVSGLFLLGVLLAVGSGSSPKPSVRTRILLVFLRLAIGWHFFVEGVDKLDNPNWSSAGYLRESTGPLAPYFRELAGEPLIDMLTPSDSEMPLALTDSWNYYLDAVDRYYALGQVQFIKIKNSLLPLKAETIQLLRSKQKLIEKISPYPPSLKLPISMPERLAEYQALQIRALDIERDLLAQYGSEAFEKWKTARANANKWRGELQRDLGSINKEMKRVVRRLLLEFAIEGLPGEETKKLKESAEKLREQTAKDVKAADEKDWDAIDSIKDKAEDKIGELYRVFFFERDQKKEAETPLATLVRENVLAKKLKNELTGEPLPFPVTAPIREWSHLEWADHVVKYGIIAVGLLLFFGLFTRTACVAGAGFLLLFFLAMPPLPGWPESPRAEGHYLFINKNVIEMLALLVLATTRSGRWSGLDGLVQFLNPFRWRRTRGEVIMEK